MATQDLVTFTPIKESDFDMSSMDASAKTVTKVMVKTVNVAWKANERAQNEHLVKDRVTDHHVRVMEDQRESMKSLTNDVAMRDKKLLEVQEAIKILEEKLKRQDEKAASLKAENKTLSNDIRRLTQPTNKRKRTDESTELSLNDMIKRFKVDGEDMTAKEAQLTHNEFERFLIHIGEERMNASTIQNKAKTRSQKFSSAKLLYTEWREKQDENDCI